MTRYSPMLIIGFILLLVFTGMGLYHWTHINDSSIATCHQVIDKNDNQTTTIRQGNNILVETLYHGYDVCIDNEGNATKTDLGYKSEIQIMLYGVSKR